jgi:predicted DNA-binding ribbon-helix-helix protein
MRLTFRLEDDLYEVVRAMARDEDITMSEAVNRESSPRPS